MKQFTVVYGSQTYVYLSMVDSHQEGPSVSGRGQKPSGLMGLAPEGSNS